MKMENLSNVYIVPMTRGHDADTNNSGTEHIGQQQNQNGTGRGCNTMFFLDFIKEDHNL